MVSRQEFAEFFELQEVLVGAGFVNQAKKGQAASMARVWGSTRLSCTATAPQARRLA